MKRVVCFFLPLALWSGPAYAQIPPRVSTPATQTHGVTVNGSASTRISATVARVTLQLATSDNRADLHAKRLQPLIDTLIQQGVPKDAIQLPPPLVAGGASNVAAVTFNVPSPSVAMMRSGMATIGASVLALDKVRLTSAYVVLHADDCNEGLAKARAQALALARAKADAIAQDIHAHLGDVLSVQAFDNSVTDGSCTAQYWVGPQGPQFNTQFSKGDDDDYVTIPVTSTVTVTYAIK